jgi:COPII coat assembly protein SEC16
MVLSYLLSPSTSLLAGKGVPSARYTLLGAESSQIGSQQQGDEFESIILTEIVEFALSLNPTVKGQEPFVGFQHLQAYKVLHAMQLADMGMKEEALR